MANVTILIIEDEVWLSKALKRRLSGEEKYTVMVASDGETGLAQALAQHPSIILLDLRLPRLDGMELLKRLRADEWGARVPVVILSNENSFAAIKEGVERNAQAYLVKADTSLERIVDTINNLTSSAQS